MATLHRIVIVTSMSLFNRGFVKFIFYNTVTLFEAKYIFHYQ